MTIGLETDPQHGLGLPVELIEKDEVKKCKNCESSTIEQSASENYATANPRPDTPISQESEEILRIKRENFARIEEYIQKTEEKITRIDKITAFFRKYPQANNSFATIMDQYSDRSLHELMWNIDENNIHDGDEMKRFALLYNFFKGRQDLENDLSVLFNACAPQDSMEP